MMRVEREQSASGEDIKQWCRLADDYNGIHLDSNRAKSAGFDDEVVPGVLTMAWVSGCLDQLGKTRDEHLLLAEFEDVCFFEPIFTDEEVTVAAEVDGLKAGMNEVRFEVEKDSETAAEGIAQVFLK